MQKKITFEIPGKPVGKGRPKFSTVNGFAKTYTPKATSVYENLVKMCYADYCSKNGDVTLEGNIGVHITAYFPIPTSLSKKKQAALNLSPYPHKPDVDNICKSILDSLNGLLFKDDSQVTKIIVDKVYGEKPKAIFTAWEVTDETDECFGSL